MRSSSASDVGDLVRNFEDSRQGWFWSTDSDGRLTYLSESVCEQLGVGQEELLGGLFAGFFALAEDESAVSRSLPFLLLKRSRFEKLALRASISDGEWWWSVSGSPQFDSAGNFVGFLGSAIDISEQRKSSEHASQLAKFDSLTGLSNRLRMSEVLEASLAASNHHGRPCAIMSIDLDRFKQVNDTLGHPAGDALLNQVAERLLNSVGDKETVSRLGGDEFQIIIPDCGDRRVLEGMATRIIAAVSQPYSIGGSRCSIGASIGVAAAPDDGQSREELIRNADLALYASKADGRGRCRFFSSELLRVAEDKRILEEELRDALAKGQIELAYQPIVDANTHCATGVEALLRWHHPIRGIISPATFIPIAEETDLIGPLGEWALRKACEDAAKWPGSLRVAVNVSPVQFSQPSLPKIVVSALAASGLAPNRLELEITEGVLLSDSPETDAMFAALKEIGVRLALDDFGTGYSSLGYLRTAPFDKIKIDQSFVRSATLPRSRNRAIIAAIVALADAVGMETTAEGIETLDQLQLIRSLGASHIQGFVYSKAVSCDEVMSHIEQGSWQIAPTGPVQQRSERQSMYRTAGAICGSRYYPVLIRNMSESGALVEGLGEPPVGDVVVIDFGKGDLAFATVRRSSGRQWGVAFHQALVSDDDNGFAVATRYSAEMLAHAGFPAGSLNSVTDRGIRIPVTPEKLAETLGVRGSSAADGSIPYGTTAAKSATVATFRELSVQYLDSLCDDRQAQEMDDRYLRQHLLPRFGHVRSDQIDEAELGLWVDGRIGEQACSDEEGRRLRVIVDQLRKLGSVRAPDEPTDRPKPSSSTVNDSQLTADESDALIAAINASPNRQLKFILSLLILTGARQRELLQARWSDIDLDRRAWKMTKLRSGEKSETPLDAAAIQVIAQLNRAEGCDFMFANPTTRKPYHSLAKGWDTARTKAGLSDLEIDDLRYCIGNRALFVTQLLDLIEDEGPEAEGEGEAPAAALRDDDASQSTQEASEFRLLEAVPNGCDIRLITDQRPSHERERPVTPAADVPGDASAVLVDEARLELPEAVVSDEPVDCIISDQPFDAEREGQEISAVALFDDAFADAVGEPRRELPELPVPDKQEMLVVADDPSDPECDARGTHAAERPEDGGEALADAPELELREAAATNGQAIVEDHGLDIECGQCEVLAAACSDYPTEAATVTPATQPAALPETNRPEVRVARRQTLLEKWWTHQGSNLGPAD
jgi:diguanylate cyclase (GGDEF)-like protein/PAS domain S-box-containing protein